MLDSLNMEGSSFATTKPNVGQSNLGSGVTTEVGRSEQPRPPSNKDNLLCNYCKNPRHTKENCWETPWETTVLR